MYLTDDSPLVQIYPYLFAVCCRGDSQTWSFPWPLSGCPQDSALSSLGRKWI